MTVQILLVVLLSHSEILNICSKQH